MTSSSSNPHVRWATCITNRGADLVNPARDHFYTPTTTFTLTAGQRYPIVGLGMFGSILVVLVVDDSRSPNWVPPGVLDLSRFAIPRTWAANVVDRAGATGGSCSNWVFLMGPPAMGPDATTVDLLTDRDDDALEQFWARIGRLDEQAEDD